MSNEQDKDNDINVNTQRRKQLLRYWGLGAGAAILLVAGAYILMGGHGHHTAVVSKDGAGTKPNFVTVDNSQFNQDESKEAQQVEQATIDEQQEQIKALSKQEKDLSDQLKKLSTDGTAQQQALQEQVAQLSTQMTSGQGKGMIGAGGISTHQIQTFSVHFNSEQAKPNTLSAKNYVPSATLVPAVLMGAADANASVTGQTNTIPVIFRLLDNGLEPTQSVNGNNHQLRAPLKGCSVIGSTFGDISSERAEVRLVRLSCNRADGTVLDIPVQGTVYEGLEGIKGTPIMRNGEVVAWAGLSGFVSGLGQAFQQAATTQTTTAAGVANSITPNQSLQYGAYGGASSAFTMLSQYWIQRAEQYHPVIEIKPGTIVTIAFTQGFSLTPQVTADSNVSSTASSGGITQNNQGSIQQAQSLMQQISSGQTQQSAGLGQTIN